MKCPRCSLFDIPDGAPGCAVCGYQLPGITAETTPPPAASPPPTSALTELDARRELAREFRIEALLPTEDEATTAVYLAYDPRQDRQVQVKVAPRQPLRDAGAEDRFRRAAEAAAALVGDFAVAEVVVSARAAAEAFNARGPTAGADQYALAALAYECLSGTRPAGDASPKLSELRADIPPHVSEALRQGLSKRPAE